MNVRQKPDCVLFAIGEVPGGSKWETWSKVDPKSPCDVGSKMFIKQADEFVRVTRSHPHRLFESWNTMFPSEYYSRTFGHWPERLEVMYKGLQSSPACSKFVWLAGDSTFDNYFDLYNFGQATQKAAVPGYAQVLHPQTMYPDVSYLLNEQIQAHSPEQGFCAINTAKYGSTIGERVGPRGKLTPQDKFLRDHMSDDDILIVSLGGNDFHQWPGVLNTASLFYQDSQKILDGRAIGFQRFVNLFKDSLPEYIAKLMSQRKPKKVIVSMQYYVREVPGGAGFWDKVLRLARYNKHPDRFQAVIARLFIDAITQIQLNGTSVRFVPMFRILNGKDYNDYLPDRLHPSEQGGRKMAQTLLPYITEDE